MIIDATNSIVGRIATVAAKQALLGEEIVIVNCEKAYITGGKKYVVNDYIRKRKQGTWATGPFYHRQPDRLVRRIIRGMLPYKQEKGKSAFQRIMCYMGIPEEFKDQKMTILTNAQISDVPNLKYISIGEISRLLGAKRTGE
ncbi:MAG: 50S ribosomal protein L13 [Candidatus Woesearchaeota archaeon]|jgi:large subunit ribosomal protein L13